LDINCHKVIKHNQLYGDRAHEANELGSLAQLSRRPAALKYSSIYELFPEEVKTSIWRYLPKWPPV